MSDKFDPYYEWLGIPPKDQPPNHYRLLGIELFEANENVIDRAADRQMGHVRTFQTGQNARESQRLLNELSKAKICLLNRDKKAAYDASLRQERQELSGPVPLVSPVSEIDAALPPPAIPGLPPLPLPPQLPSARIPPPPVASNPPDLRTGDRWGSESPAPPPPPGLLQPSSVSSPFPTSAPGFYAAPRATSDGIPLPVSNRVPARALLARRRRQSNQLWVYFLLLLLTIAVLVVVVIAALSRPAQSQRETNSSGTSAAPNAPTTPVWKPDLSE